jgi:hypothetical protein
MSRIGFACLAAFSGAAVAQPADAPAGSEPLAEAAITVELAHRMWAVASDALTPLPPAPDQPVQFSVDVVRSGNAREISQAKLDFERRNDAELRALHDSIDFAERQALQAYVTAGRIELPQIRRTVFMELACHGKAKSGVEFAAAKLAADERFDERLLQIVEGLATVLDDDSFDRVTARATSASGFKVVNLRPTSAVARYSTMSQRQLAAELRRDCGITWSHHSDGAPA